MEKSALNDLPDDTVHYIFSRLPLHTIAISKTLCKSLNATLSSQPFTQLLASLNPNPNPLTLLTLRNSHRSTRRPAPNPPAIHSFDPTCSKWVRFDLAFLPFQSAHPVTSSNGIVYLWCDSSLVMCNPLSREFRVLPTIGSAWSRHGSVVIGPEERVMVVSQLAVIGLSKLGNRWVMFSSNLPAKCRSPILVGECVYALCDVGSPWRNVWRMYSCRVGGLNLKGMCDWSRLELAQWGDVFDVLKRPRLVRGIGNRILMVGGLRLNAVCSTIVILRLDLGTMEWDEVGRMPDGMFRCFSDSSKFKAFGGGDMVCFSAKNIGKRLVLWEYGEGNGGDWRWIDGLPGSGDGICRGFVLKASLAALP